MAQITVFGMEILYQVITIKFDFFNIHSHFALTMMIASSKHRTALALISVKKHVFKIVGQKFIPAVLRVAESII